MLSFPTVILFDWHGTLVDTMEAMYRALDDTLPRLRELGIHDRLLRAEASRTPEDARLLEYVRQHGRLHPRIPAEKKVSRSDLLELLFGLDEEAKAIAHDAYSRCYARHYGAVRPFEDGIREILVELRSRGIRTAIQTNRNRQFLEAELARVDAGRWVGLFDYLASGSDGPWRKPAPEALLRTLQQLAVAPGPSCWFLGDSTTDVTAAKAAGITSVLFNGAHWAPEWLERVFPGTADFPHKPDAVVEDFAGLMALIRELEKDGPTA